MWDFSGKRAIDCSVSQVAVSAYVHRAFYPLDATLPQSLLEVSSSETRAYGKPTDSRATWTDVRGCPSLPSGAKTLMPLAEVIPCEERRLLVSRAVGIWGVRDDIAGLHQEITPVVLCLLCPECCLSSRSTSEQYGPTRPTARVRRW